MKYKILLVSLTILLSGCSIDADPDCQCYRTTYKAEIVTVIVNGVREERWTRNIIDNVEIKCKDEVTAQSIGNGLFIDIECY